MDGVTPIRLAFGGVEATVPGTWRDITDEVEADAPPYTLADPDEGVGALQFSIAAYQGGAMPAPSREELRDMALGFGKERDCGKPFEERLFTDEFLRGAAMSFRREEDFLRVWYISDGWNVAFITYVCEWSEQDRELSVCEDIVKSVRFRSR
ncbi:MAG TPA: hypothetical protein VFF38_08475 [Microvirga sp.]|nr:hypothetical protein [Microvirga sp.]